MKNISIKRLIAIVIGALILLTIVVGVLGYRSTQRSVDLLENMALRSANQQLAMSSLQLRMEMNRSHILQALQHNPENKHAALHNHPLSFHSDFIAGSFRKLREEHEALKNDLVREETRDRFEAWMNASDNLGMRVVDEAMQAIIVGDWDSANEILGKKINPTYNKSLESFNELQSFMSERNRRQSTDLHEELSVLNAITIAALIAAILLSCGAGLYLIRAIGAPLSAAVELARRVANGDLSAQPAAQSRNEFGQLLGALADMTSSLAGIVKDVRAGSEVIAAASTQIASGNMDLSSRTEAQASALEETASSIEELSSTVRQNADNARQANELAASATDIAIRGGNVVTEVVSTMGQINESARKIVDIISVIDGIAFQTNILALNAAVEAARAGEQGRGFAVVASEVRNLAHRSASAAKEIKELISDSVGKVDAGARLVDQAGATMEEIVQGVQRVAGIMGEISVASAEQSSGIEQIHQAISQMDQSTQQNAALVEEAASAAVSMQESAASLTDRVSVFKLDASQVAGSTGASSRRAERDSTRPYRMILPA